MKVAIIGAGFTGLSAALALQKKGHTVTLFEKDPHPGGLAVGYKVKGWDWSLEKHYHHWFTNDSFILDLAKETSYEVIRKRPKTSVYLDGKSYQLDSPYAIMTFPKLALIDKLRMSATLAFLRFNPFWKPLEKFKATSVLPKMMGQKAFSLLWEPQLRNKMGKYTDEISLVWFWTRVYKRTPSLAYPSRGFLDFAQHLTTCIKKQNGVANFETEITEINDNGKTTISYLKNNEKYTESFDKIIVTLPSFLFLKITPQLPEEYKEKLIKLKGLGATNMVLRLSQQFLSDGTYWLSICEENSPVMVVVEHTNLMDKKNYNNEHLIYVGNYLESDSDEFAMTKEELLERYSPLLEKIHPGFKDIILGYDIFKAPFAQPIVPMNYSKMIPPLKTPLPNVLLANIEQVYPWDRGTNYAVELGQKVSQLIP